MELLIVVVVIAILAAITIVAYNGITNNAKESALKSDLTTAAKKLHVAKVEDGSFPSSADSSLIPDGLTYSGGGDTFCVTGSANGKDFRITESGSVEEGDCAAPVATTMQTFTGAHCSALPTFTSSNNEAVIQLTDSRGGTTRTYDVAKLQDNNCWMLTNLKLGSTSGPITLTPADSNVASNFTLPQLATAGNYEYDLPRAYGPVPGDTGSGATNYGYLYNWPAATAGLTTSFVTGDAPHSICPAGWKLPTGGSPSSDFGQLDVDFDGTGAYVSGSSSIPKWQPTGPFRGSFSGYWNSGFDDQGGWGSLWSASAVPDDPGYAFRAGFGPSNVLPGDGGDDRSYGFGVRCLLN